MDPVTPGHPATLLRTCTDSGAAARAGPAAKGDALMLPLEAARPACGMERATGRASGSQSLHALLSERPTPGGMDLRGARKAHEMTSASGSQSAPRAVVRAADAWRHGPARGKESE